jgi:transposase
MDKKIIRKPVRYYTESEKHKIIQEFISTDFSKAEIWRKFTGQEDHGRLLIWMRELGYDAGIKARIPKVVLNLNSMPSKKTNLSRPKTLQEETFETLQLQKRIVELEKQLKDAELKAIAFSTMVDIAEKEFNIPIRKKFNTKP